MYYIVNKSSSLSIFKLLGLIKDWALPGLRLSAGMWKWTNMGCDLANTGQIWHLLAICLFRIGKVASWSLLGPWRLLTGKLVTNSWMKGFLYGTNQRGWGRSGIHVIIFKFSAPPCTKNGLCVGVSLLSQVQLFNASPEMLFICVDPTWMTGYKHSRLGLFQEYWMLR